MFKIIEILKNIFDNITILMIIFIGALTLLIDGKRLKDKNFMKEFRIVKIISFSYIVIGIVMFMFLKVV